MVSGPTACRQGHPGTHGGGHRITVYYDPEDPNVVAITREIEFDSALLIFVMGAVAAAAGALWVRHRWKQPQQSPTLETAT